MDGGVSPATLGPRPHHERAVVLRERTKVLPLDSCVSVTDRHGGGGGGSRIRVSSGEVGEVEGSEEASII